MSPPPLRVAAVSYLNAAPLVWGLIHGPSRDRFQVGFMVPACCADALRDGEVDAGIIPSIEYQRIPGLKIIPGLSIASAGPVRSVLLISQCPIQKIRSLALDTSSRTSACLAQILLQRHYQVVARLEPEAPNLRTMLSRCDAALMIGDPALASDFPGLMVYDLAEEWRAMTGLPFVFAIWAVRQEAASPDLVKDFQQATSYALVHLEEIARSEAKRTGLTPSLIREYLTKNIDFSLSAENLKGLRLFYRLAKELGLTNGARPLEFVSSDE